MFGFGIEARALVAWHQGAVDMLMELVYRYWDAT